MKYRAKSHVTTPDRRGDNLAGFWHSNGYSAFTKSFSDHYRLYAL